MARPSFRRTMTLEGLEKREVLSAPAADGTTQYALELLNMARTQPAAAAQWLQSHADANVQATLAYYHVDLQQELSQIASASAQPPLAYDNQLAAAAQAHSQDQASHNFQGHQGSDGSTSDGRIQAAGYANASSTGEDAYAYANSVDHSMEAFLLDWGVADKGHRRNILQPGVSGDNAYRDVGIGIVNTGQTPTPGKVGPNIVTIDFASKQNQQAQLLGVVYNDAARSGLYSPNQGVGGALIRATNASTGQASWTFSSDAGGYQMPLTSGSYHVTATVNGQVVGASDVNVGNANVKVDFNTAIGYIAPVQAPTPAPVQRQVTISAPAPAPIVVVSAPTPSAPTAPAAAPSTDPLSWITSWSAFRNGVRIS